MSLAGKIEQRAVDKTEILNQRVSNLADRSVKEREQQLQATQQKRLKAMRQLANQRKNIEEKFIRRDIIEEYGDYGSTVFLFSIASFLFHQTENRFMLLLTEMD